MDYTIVMFTGQGCQHIGMGRNVDTHTPCRAVWDCASDIAGFDVRKLCWKGPMNKLSQTYYQQIAVTAVNLASYYALLEETDGIEADTYIGHSVGEYSALHATGVLELEDTFKAVYARAEAMQDLAVKSKGSMYAIKGIGQNTAMEIIERLGLIGQVVIANDNSPRQVVIAGPTFAVKPVITELYKLNYSSLKLPTNGAWHSPIMKDMEQPFRRVVSKLSMRKPARRLLMNTTASEPASVEEIIENMVSHVCETVRWRDIVEKLLSEGHKSFLEIGPRRVLCGLLPDFDEISEDTDVKHFSQLIKNNSRKPISSPVEA